SSGLVIKPPQVGQPTVHRSPIFIVSARRLLRHERLLSSAPSPSYPTPSYTSPSLSRAANTEFLSPSIRARARLSSSDRRIPATAACNLLVRAATQTVRFAVVVEHIDLFVQPPQRQVILDPLVPGHGVVVIVVEHQDWRLHPVRVEDGGVFNESH